MISEKNEKRKEKIMKSAVAKAHKNRIKVEGFEKKGFLIVIEGNDGAGKSTIVKLLSKYLKGQGYDNIIVKFNMSYITLKSIKRGKKMYFGPEANTLMHLTSIIDQFERYVCKEIEKGKIVICDRYVYSIIARGIARGIEKDIAVQLTDWMVKPDIVFFLDINPKESLKRIGADKITFWEAGQDVIYGKRKEICFLEFQKMVRKVFLKYSKKWEFIILNSTNSSQELLKNIVDNLRDINIIS